MNFKILIRKLNNNLSKKEEILFNSWYNESAAHRNYFNRVKSNYSKDIGEIDMEKAWNDLSNKLSDRSNKNAYLKYAAVAAIFLLISISILTHYLSSGISENQPTISHIQSGSNKAILTLEDGSHMLLEKNTKFSNSNMIVQGDKLSYNKSLKEHPSTELKYNYLTIPRGGQYFVELSDGTQVWLNSESKLKYPVTFVEGEQRKIELVYGEAYIDVTPSSKNHGSTFNVHTKSQNITVLGTEFNIRAYADENVIYTTLAEGKVILNIKNDQVSLKPGEQSYFNLSDKEIVIRPVDVAYIASWKDGYFMFDQESLGSMMKTLSRWYDLEVIFEEENRKDIIFSGILKRSDSVEELLSTIEKTGEIEFVIKDKTIIIK